LIVVAGPGINFLFAILLFFALGNMSQDGLQPILGDVPQGSIAQKIGLQAGDRITAIDGKAVNAYGQRDLYIYNQVLKGDDFRIQVERAGKGLVDAQMDVSDISVYRLGPSVMARQLGLTPVAPQIDVALSRIMPNSPAEQAGLQVGDRIIAIDNVTINNWEQLVSVVSQSAGVPLQFSVERDAVVVTVQITPNGAQIGDQTVGRIGIAPSVLPYPDRLKVEVNRSVVESIVYGIEQTWLMSSVTVRMLGKMIVGEASHENISGPITIAQVSGDAIQIGLDYYLNILAVISISLGVMNLLPIPMLDGGHLLAYAVEAVAGQRVSEQFYAAGQRVGIFLLACLMSLAFYNDIFRLLN